MIQSLVSAEIQMCAASPPPHPPVPADGHCLYRAVEDQLSTSGSGGADMSALRQQAAAYIREHPQDFSPFIYDEVGVAS